MTLYASLALRMSVVKMDSLHHPTIMTPDGELITPSTGTWHATASPALGFQAATTAAVLFRTENAAQTAATVLTVLAGVGVPGAATGPMTCSKVATFLENALTMSGKWLIVIDFAKFWAVRFPVHKAPKCWRCFILRTTSAQHPIRRSSPPILDPADLLLQPTPAKDQVWEPSEVWEGNLPDLTGELVPGEPHSLRMS